MGPSRSPPRGPVRGHDPRPPRPGKRRFGRLSLSLAASASASSPSTSYRLQLRPASDGYKTFASTPSREALLNISFSTGDYSGH